MADDKEAADKLIADQAHFEKAREEGKAVEDTDAPKETAPALVAQVPAQDVPLARQVLDHENEARAASKTETARIQALAKSASVNTAEVEFPLDPWGFTSELRKVGLLTASKVGGQADKHLALVATLMILMGHVRNRLEADKDGAAKDYAELQANFESSESYARQHARPYDPEDAVRSALSTLAEAKRSGQFTALLADHNL